MVKILSIIYVINLLFTNVCFASYADLVEELIPSVVNISTTKEANGSDFDESKNIDNLMIEPQFEGREALGSGFFIRKEGYILTNKHVIDGAKAISVITENDITYDAKLVGVDSKTDIAVLKITSDSDKQFFSPVNFGNADTIRIGDNVLTFGNPYGLGVSVSTGIISAKSRNIGLNDQQYLQTDAAINQGNSGGPMFNIDGEVIGVNSAIFSSNGANGVGFSLPSNIANWVSNQIIKNGKVRRNWLGFQVAHGIDMATKEMGFLINEIDEQSMAYKEGLRVGHVIMEYNGKKAHDLYEFTKEVEQLDINDELILMLSYDGTSFTKRITAEELPITKLNDVAHKALIENKKYYNESKSLGSSHYIPEFKSFVIETETKGLEITKIERGSIFYDKGIKVGDIIIEIDRAEMYSINNLFDILTNLQFTDYKPLTLLVQSDINIFYVTIQLEPSDD